MGLEEENRLIVVDDADGRVGQLDMLLKTRRGRLRVLAIARQPGNWWETVRRRYDELIEPEPLMVVSPPVAERVKVYEDAWASFFHVESARKGARAANSAERPSAMPKSAVSDDLGDEDFESYLFILILALIDVRRCIDPEWPQPGVAPSVTRGEALYDQVLDLEREDWIKGAEKAGLSPDPVLLDRIVAVASLAYAGGDTDGHAESEAARRLRIVPDLADASEEIRRRFVRILQERIEGDGALRPLHPQRLAERLITKMIRSFPEVVGQLLEPSPYASDADAAQQAVSTLQLMNVLTFEEAIPKDSSGYDRSDKLYQALSTALRQHGPELIVLAQKLVDDKEAIGKSLSSTLEAVFAGLRASDNDVAALAAGQLEEFSPDALLRLARVLQKLASDYYKGLPHNAQTRVKLGDSYKRLSHLLADSGERRAAHHYALRAVEHFNALVRTDESDKQLLRKANALSNLTVRDYEIERFHESLESAREAVGLYERLLQRNHDQMHHVHLCFALCNLSDALALLGRWREALHAANEGCDLVEVDLPHDAGDPPAGDSDVKAAQALACRTLARRLPEAEGSPDAVGDEINNAIRRAEKARDLYDELEEGRPGRFTRDYALSRVILGRRYADGGLWKKSVNELEGAAGTYTLLAQDYQEAIRTRHADALRDLAASYLGRGQEKENPDRDQHLRAGLTCVNEALLSITSACLPRTNSLAGEVGQ